QHARARRPAEIPSCHTFRRRQNTYALTYRPLNRVRAADTTTMTEAVRDLSSDSFTQGCSKVLQSE
ncbi:hypothetical protein ACIQB5_51915, partial [Streptomyces sp. NPDC088560]|uniref:hypothetical protein n=1 Tax=Streptomyces sp. NPDC088560 TaxID=3365868 RepID=UPI003830F256